MADQEQPLTRPRTLGSGLKDGLPLAPDLGLAAVKEKDKRGGSLGQGCGSEQGREEHGREL
jgi:hypothetical protein